MREPRPVLHFGRYADRPIDKVPDSYLHFLLRVAKAAWLRRVVSDELDRRWGAA